MGNIVFKVKKTIVINLTFYTSNKKIELNGCISYCIEYKYKCQTYTQ